jgi:pimeloyl-ACP methyl ester carboxylesterase
MRLEHRMVRTNGVRLHCAVSGEGPLVILLHGFPECWYSWRHQIPALAERCRVVAPDLRGYNESEKPAGVAAYAMPELVADVEGLIDAFGGGDAAIVGHDWGGAVSWHFAMERPARTRRLAVLNCPHPAMMMQHLRENPRQLARSWYMFFFQIPRLPEFLLQLGHARPVARAIERSAVRRDDITEDDLRRLRDAAMHSGALRSALNYYRAAFRDPQNAANLPPPLRRFLYGDRPLPPPRRTLADWPRIAAPTLLIWGEQDVALDRALTEGMEPLFAGPFAVRYIPDSGHWVQQEQPALVTRWLLEFLTEERIPATASA